LILVIRICYEVISWKAIKTIVLIASHAMGATLKTTPHKKKVSHITKGTFVILIINGSICVALVFTKKLAETCITVWERLHNIYCNGHAQ
jgi:hypothetical protein